MARTPIPAYLEVGTRRVFAGAMEWPGWARSGKDETAALEALAASGPRFAAVLKAARIQGFAVPRGPDELEVVERLTGDATTDFGAPSASPSVDADPLEGREMERYLAILRASWKALDRASRAAKGRVLRKGPRGGGRTRAAIVEHVVDAESAYLGPLWGTRPAVKERAARASAMREAVVEAIEARVAGEPMPPGRRSATVWTPRYGVRRVAWHALDHAWEIEDRSGTR